MYRLVTVHEYERGLHYRKGKFVGELGPGRYRLWFFSGREVWVVDLRETGLQVPGQEVLTADGANVRLNVLVRYRIADPVKAIHETASYTDSLYQMAQLAARELVVQRELAVLLKDRGELSPALTERVRQQASAFGLEVRLVALKDLGLDVSLRASYEAKLAADQQGQARLVEARHAVAVARAQANAAKILADNPGIAVQKQLEVLAMAAEHGMDNHFIVVPESVADIVKKLSAP